MKLEKIAVDCRELNRTKLRSLGLILIEVIPRLAKYYDVVLLSDSRLSKGILDKLGLDEDKNHFMGNQVLGGVSVFFYHKWIKKISKKLKFDVLWQVNHFMLCNLSPIKVIITVHDLFPLSKIGKINLKSKIIYWLSLKMSFRNSQLITTPSNFTKEAVVNTFKISENKLHVIYNGVSRSSSKKTSSNIKLEGDYILYLGRLCKWKGTDKLLSLINCRNFPQNYKLVLAGICQEDIKYDLLENLNRNKNLVYFDYVTEEDKEYLLENTKLFIYPSRYDGFGIPPLEAGIRKVPLLMSDIDVLKEISKNQGEYFNVNTPDEDICSKIQQILNEPYSEKNRIIENMFEISKEYSWDNFTLNLVKLIEKIIKGEKGDKFEEGTFCC
jgi:glycosyltransferase involved in cell wall biosynthesis